MRIVDEYRHNAKQCRKLAQKITEPDWRDVLEKMAESWDRLADEHELDLEPDEHLSRR
jgi:hypothetical protein